MRWHKVVLGCPKCKAEPTLLELLASGDGEVMLQMCCVQCGISLQWISNSAKLVAGAIYSDIEEAMAKKEPQQRVPIQPPLALPAPTLTKQDERDLHKWGIDPASLL